MKKKVSKAIAFLQKIGAKKVREKTQIIAELSRRLSSAEADDVYDRWMDIDLVGTVKDEGYREIMKFFNESYDRSIGASLTLDYEFYRTVFSACEKAENLFGKTVMEYGCRNGIQSCFLAQLLPDSRILSIDDCDCGLCHAETLRDGLGITNVTFRKNALEDIPDGEKYDTVVLTQTFYRKGFVPGIPTGYSTMMEQARVSRQEFTEYVELAIKNIADGGHLVVFDFTNFGPEMLSLVLELASRGFRWLSGPSERGTSFMINRARVTYFSPYVMFFEKVVGDVAQQDMLNDFVSCMLSAESRKLPGCYFNEAAHAQLQRHAGKIVAGFSATFEYEDSSCDMAAGVVYRDTKEDGTYWREMQTSKEICVCKCTDKALERVTVDLWDDAQAAIAHAPDVFLLLSGEYGDVNRERIADFSKVPQKSQNSDVSKIIGVRSEDTISLIPKIRPIGHGGRLDRHKSSPGAILDNLINKLDPNMGTKEDDIVRIRLMKRGNLGRKRKNRKAQIKSDDLVHEASPIKDKQTAPALEHVEKTLPPKDLKRSAGGLKLTYFAKSGRLNVEDQNSGSQWCATGKGTTFDGEPVESMHPVRIGETGLFIGTSERSICLRDGNCGYHFTIKLA